MRSKASRRIKLTSNEVEAANRAEVTALLVRAGYRVYRPEADCYGEDLVIRTPKGELRAVQLKSRPTVDRERYGRSPDLWMIFPDAPHGAARSWFLVKHLDFYRWVRRKHGHTLKWREAWSYPKVSKELGEFLAPFLVNLVK